ncbi:Zinc finger matrin-type protein 5 [Bulinus truncatus]|nr:Zinc finger matrin-type protein 5 [Bulinus truncatus]
MGKRYYCDYCDKSFADNPTSRKVHLTGNIHLLNKKAHYDLFRDEKEILEDDKKKKPCRAYLSTGNCKFGDKCLYSHLTNDDRLHLSEIVRQKDEVAKARLFTTESKGENVQVLLKCWVDQRNKRMKQDCPESDGSAETVHAIKVPDYKLADCLTVFTNLPPSLLPPSKEAILNSRYVSWGTTYTSLLSQYHIHQSTLPGPHSPVYSPRTTFTSLLSQYHIHQSTLPGPHTPVYSPSTTYTSLLSQDHIHQSTLPGPHTPVYS